MAEYIFKTKLSELLTSSAFAEASREELKILLTLIVTEGKAISVDELARLADVSVARAKSAITLLTESGIIAQDSADGTAEIEYEFKTKNEDRGASALEISKSVRDNDLYELGIEFERMLGKSLSTYEIGTIARMYTDKGISPQYMLLLTSYLIEARGSIKVSTVERIADELIKSGTETLEELEIYIEEKSREVKGEMEMRGLLGIRGRSLTPTERKYFSRWLHDFGYSSVIIGEAYDICVNSTGDKSLKFMDKVLTAWHEGGCKTLAECQAQHDLHIAQSKQKQSRPKKAEKPEAKTPKYAEFDSEDALMRALERSYGNSSGKKEGE